MRLGEKISIAPVRIALVSRHVRFTAKSGHWPIDHLGGYAEQRTIRAWYVVVLNFLSKGSNVLEASPFRERKKCTSAARFRHRSAASQSECRIMSNIVILKVRPAQHQHKYGA